MLDKDSDNLWEFLSPFFFFLPIVSVGLAHDPKLIEEIAYAFCKRQKESNVIYSEARYSPHLMLPDNGGKSMTPEERMKQLIHVVDMVQQGFKRGQKDFGVHVNQILCCICFNPEWSPEVYEL